MWKMNWGSVENFWAMGGYAPYVWGSYGVTVLIVVLEIWTLRARRRRARAEVLRIARTNPAARAA
jgi:heme exporter protein D